VYTIDNARTYAWAEVRDMGGKCLQRNRDVSRINRGIDEYRPDKKVAYGRRRALVL
jgi:hypothetical protein